MIQTEAEAKLFFNWEEGEYPGDVFQAKMFEYKTFFITKPPIRKVFFAKLNKLVKMVEAYHFLLNVDLEEPENREEIPVQFSQNWLKDYNLLQEKRAFFKRQIFNYSKPKDLRATIENWLDTEEKYQDIYGKIVEKEQNEELLASQEIDPMEFLEALKQFSLANALTSEFLKNNCNQLPIVLKNELKRLNLLLKIR